MASARFIICERSNRWAVALRWALADTGVRVYETRSWADCRRELDTSPASILGLELRRDNLEEVVRGLLLLRRSYPAARAVVLGSRDLRDALEVVFEAGAVHLAESTRNLDATARLVRRHLEGSPGRERDYVQSVRDRLPW